MKTVCRWKNAIKTPFSCLVLALLLCCSLSSYGLAQEEELLDVRLGLIIDPANPGTRYLLNPPDTDPDPIMAVVTIENVSAPADGELPARELLATKGYADNLHLLLRFVDPDGLQVTAQSLLPETYGKNLPTFPDLEKSENVPGEPVEVVPATDPDGNSPYIYSTEAFNIRRFYNFRKAGRHTGRAFVSAGIYELSALIEGTTDFANTLEVRAFGGDFISNEVAITLIDDADNDGACVPVQHPELCPEQPLPDCEDRPAGADGVLGTADDGANIGPDRVEIANNGLDDDCNPATLDTQLVEFGTVAVEAVTHTVGPGPKPPANKAPIVNMLVRIFDKSEGSCLLTRFGVSWQHYEDVWNGCPNVFQGYARTDAEGEATLNVAPGDLVLIGQYDPDGSTTAPAPDLSGDEIYIGRSVGELATGDIIRKFLQVIIKQNGKNVPAKNHKLKGSELMIIEPEYVEWDGTEEYYPLVFESVGDWNVQTSVAPPEGFVADHDSLTEDVNNELEAVQFTITDLGTKWNEPHEFTIEATHKKKKQKIKTKVYQKLTKEKAKKLKLDIYGNELKEEKEKKEK